MSGPWATLVFDCDGVLLNSNPIKTEAFRVVGRRYGEAAAEALVAHHIAHGGVSRRLKFQHLIDVILARPAEDGELDALCEAYGAEVVDQLLTCEMAHGLHDLRARSDARWMVVSGGAQDELRQVFAQRGIAAFFDAGIYGNPDSKDDILAREIESGNLERPALFIGDSRYDHQAATRAGLDFAFISGWSEFAEGVGLYRGLALPVVERISDIDGIVNATTSQKRDETSPI